MNTVAFILLVLIGLACLIALCVFARLGWIAAGESDVNGDPERDGTEIANLGDRPTDWDHGSRRTERRPNLDYARRTNRNAMIRSAGLGL